MGRKVDFASLLHPVAPATFFAEYWEEKPLLIRRGDLGYYDSLLTLDQIDSLLTVLTTDTITLKNSDASLEGSQFLQADGSLDIVKACQLFSDGATILVREAHKRLETLAELGREFEQSLGAPCQANVYVTPAGGKAFDAHYDTHDVFLLQVSGSKEWIIYDAPVRLPLAGQPFNDGEHKAGAPPMSFVLEAGDLLYIPRGFLHEGRSRNDVSIHTTVGVLAYRWADVLLEVMAQLCLEDPAFRRALPVRLGQPDFDLGEARKTFAGLLRRVVDQATPDRALEHIVDDFVVGRRPIVPGQLAQMALARDLAIGDQVGVRPSTIYRLRMTGAGAQLRAHGREITLPTEAADAIRFALTKERFAVRDLPGDFDDEEKVAIVRRLVEEGLVRKLSGA